MTEQRNAPFRGPENGNMASRREGPLVLYSTSELARLRLPPYPVANTLARRRQLARKKKHHNNNNTAMTTAAELRAAIEAHGVPLVTAEELDAQDDPQAAWQRVRMAAVWKQPGGMLERCGPGLRLVMSLGAGVDFLLGAPALAAPDGTVLVPEVLSLLPVASNHRSRRPLLVARIADPHMASRMAAWVAWGVLTWQRRMLDYAAAQKAREWAGTKVERGHNRDARDVRVGVLGYGTMGRATAALLARMGYRVSAWARRERGREGGGGGGRRRQEAGEQEQEEEDEEMEPGVEALEDWGREGNDEAEEEARPGRIRVRWPRRAAAAAAGAAGPGDGAAAAAANAASAAASARRELLAFATGLDVLVVLLPLTRDTARCVDAELLAVLAPGACLVNGARGAHVDAAAVLRALDSEGERGGGLDMALLDVFDEEPLPRDSPLWAHPRVVITPHSAAFTEVAAAARQVARCWRAAVAAAAEEGGEGAEGDEDRLARALGANLVDRAAGY